MKPPASSTPWALWRMNIAWRSNRLLVQRGPEGLPAGTSASVWTGTLVTDVYLQNLQRAGLIAQRAKPPALLSADFAVMNGLVGYLTENCCATAARLCTELRADRGCEAGQTRGQSRLRGPWSLQCLVLCTGNSAGAPCRVALEHSGPCKFRAFSAGSFPKGQVHPMAVELLRRMNLPTETFEAKLG